jgi:hypothetical protein
MSKRTQEKVLGSTPMNIRIFLCNSWFSNGRNNKKIYCKLKFALAKGLPKDLSLLRTFSPIFSNGFSPNCDF